MDPPWTRVCACRACSTTSDQLVRCAALSVAHPHHSSKAVENLLEFMSAIKREDKREEEKRRCASKAV